MQTKNRTYKETMESHTELWAVEGEQALAALLTMLVIQWEHRECCLCHTSLISSRIGVYH
jgi:hypothetical protein